MSTAWVLISPMEAPGRFGRVIVHFDEVEPRETAWSTWRDLGRAAGSVAVGVRHGTVGPGGQATPLHAHGAEEELFFVLAGGGACVTEGGDAAELRTGDAVLRRAGGRAHAFVAGTDGLRFLAFGERRPAEVVRLPRVGMLGAGRAGWAVGTDTTPLRAEAAAGVVEVPATLTRPGWVRASADVEADVQHRGDVDRARSDLGRALGSQTSGLKHVRVAPGALGVLPHCHSAEEELFYVLEGDGWFELHGGEATAVRPGHLVSRPAGTGVAHTFRAGEAGMTFLAYGQRDPNDICFYPRSSKVSIRGIGIAFRVVDVDYWDGET